MSKLCVRCLVLMAVLLAGPMVWADSGCFDYNVDAVFSGDPQNPFAPYAGVLNERIGGQPVEQVPAILIIGTAPMCIA